MGHLLRLRGVYGFWPAASDGDDIIVYRDDAAPADPAVARPAPNLGYQRQPTEAESPA